MAFFATLFFVALFGIIALFGLKYWEERHERVLVPGVRDKADARAHELKELIALGRAELAKLPPEAAHRARMLIHAGALQTARLARAMETQAHRLADLVSHKHHFERREPQSEFLKKVGERKNDLSKEDWPGKKLDTTL